MKTIIVQALVIISCVSLFGQVTNNDRYFFNPKGWSLPEKNLFSLDREKVINLGNEFNTQIIQQVYKYIGKGKHYSYYLERFARNCVFFDEFYRFFINDFIVYLIRTKNGEKILFYNIGTFAEGGVICEDGFFATTEKEYSFSVLLTDFNFDGCFDRLYPLSGGELSDVVLDTEKDIEKVKELFPYKKLFLRLLKFYDLSFVYEN